MKDSNIAMYIERTATKRASICLYHCPHPQKPCKGDCKYFNKAEKELKKRKIKNEKTKRLD